MSRSIDDLIQALLSDPALREAVEKLVPKDPLQKAALSAMLGAIEKNGLSAIYDAIDELRLAFDGELDPTDLIGLDPVGLSDFLAQLQLAEADERSRFENYATAAGQLAAKILASAFRSMLT